MKCVRGAADPRSRGLQAAGLHDKNPIGLVKGNEDFSTLM